MAGPMDESYGLRRLEVVGYVTVAVGPDAELTITSEPALAAIQQAIRHGIGRASVDKVAQVIGAPGLTDGVPDDRSFGSLPDFTPEMYEVASERRSAEFEAGLLELPGFISVGADLVFDPSDPSFLDDLMELHRQVSPRFSTTDDEADESPADRS